MASDEVALSSLLFVVAGVFAGLDVSCSSGSDFLALRVAMFFSRDFLPGGFVFGLGVGARRGFARSRFGRCGSITGFGVRRRFRAARMRRFPRCARFALLDGGLLFRSAS